MVEPSLVVYSVGMKDIDREVARMEKLLPKSLQDDGLVQRCTDKRVLRMTSMNESVKLIVGAYRRASGQRTNYVRLHSQDRLCS